MRKSAFTGVLAGIVLFTGAATATERHVPSGYTTIQAAIDVAVDGDVVIVSPGTYTGAGNRDLDFGGKAIAVRSNDPNDPCVVASTVIDCENVSGHRGFYFHNGEGPDSVVSGLTIKRGTGNGVPATGGGICCAGTSPTIKNCIISNNTVIGNTSAYGGGIYGDSGSNPSIINCIISGNTAQGGDSDNVGGDGFGGGAGLYGAATIKNCIITNNTAAGGDSYGEYTGGEGLGGGAGIRGAATVENCIIANNTAAGGTGLGNGNGIGGGIFSEGTLTIRNCTITNNNSEIGVYCEDGPTTIISSIIWGNDGLELISGSGVLNIIYSDIEGGYSGTGNINADPCFIEPVNSDYHLHPLLSPCKNTGDPSYSQEPGETDIDGEARVMGLRVDMGADEINEAGVPVIEVLPAVVEFDAEAGGANPEEQILSIRNGGTGTLTWEVMEDCNWLSVEPNSGSSTGETDDVNLILDISGLGGGIYTCELTVSDANASNNPQTANVTLHVSDADGQLHVQSEYLTIQAAIDVAVDGEVVIVAPGTYTGTGNRDLDFLGKAITVRGSDPEDPCVIAGTVIDCENATGHRGFYFHSGEDGNSVVSGLTIKRGKISIDGSTAMGGGIYCSGSSPTIENCIITNNTARGYSGYEGSGDGQSAYGGGVYCTSNSHLTLIDCNISGNNAQGGYGDDYGCDLTGDCWGTLGAGGNGSGGGIYSSSNSSVTIIDCEITGNSAKGGLGGTYYNLVGEPAGGEDGGAAVGGGIYCSSDSIVTVTGSIINNNAAVGGPGGAEGWNGGTANGGGAYGQLVMRNCTVSQNTASNPVDQSVEFYGGGLALTGSSEITNCLIIENDIINGMPAYLAIACMGQSQVVISGCTIAGHNADWWTAIGRTGTGGSLVCSDSILWDNAGSDISGATSVVYCCTEQDISGTGNIHSDPCFVSGLGGDYYLSQIAAGQAVDSPCVDAGSDTAANLEMNIRTTRTDNVTDSGVVDMGYHYSSIIGSPDIDENWHVDFVDFAILAGDWLECSDPYDSNCMPGVLTGDIFLDGYVNMYDLAILADCWLECYVTKATGPEPSDNAGNVNTNTVLAWSAGYGAIYHDVYLGTDANAVANADYLSEEYMGTVSDVNFDPCSLDVNTTYFWRIDEIGPACTAKGDLWSFTTWNEYIVSWWKFDEGSGTTAYDSAGDNDGTINGATWTTGQIGGALHFDGYSADDYVSIPDGDNSLDMDNEMTITAWVKPNDNLDVYCIAGKPTGTGFENNYMFVIEAGLLALYNDSTGYYSTSYAIAGVWQHVAVTLKEGDSVKFYINGTPAGTSAQTEPFGLVNNEPVLIGKWEDGFGLFYGDIDDVRIYNVELTAEEVEQVCQDSNLVTHWKFDEGNGTTAYDSEGDNDGTIYGATWTTGQINGALSFDGTNDYVDMNTASALDFERTDAFTLAVWYKGSSSSSTILSKLDAATGYRGYDIFLNGGYVQAHLINTWPSNSICEDGTLYPVTNSLWHHIVVTYDGSSSANGLKIYVDGMEETTSVSHNSLSSTIRNSVSFKVAARSNGSGTVHYLNGLTDDVRIYDSELTAEEVEQLYEEGL